MIMAVSRRRYPFRRAVRRLLRKEIVPGRILIMSSLLGCVTGLVCAAFQILPDLMNAFRQSCFEGCRFEWGERSFFVFKFPCVLFEKIVINARIF